MKKTLILLLLAAPLLAADENYEEPVVSENSAGEESGVMVQDSDDDIKSIVEDYIKKDESLKGAFFIEDKKSGKVLSLKYLAVLSVDNLSETEKKVKVQFADPSTGKFRNVFFFMKGSSWGNMDIEKIELEQPAEIKKPENKSENKPASDKKNAPVSKDKKTK